MATSPAASDASHDSDDAQNTSSNKAQQAVKDKECPYCQQKFTSSSLGRHLDQFISKKKPDGVHDVDEIKKLRAGITRRTARGGKRNESIEQSTSGPTSPHSSTNVAPPAFPDNSRSGDFRYKIGWQATGVITDPVPQASNTLPSPLPTNTNTAGSKRSFSTYAADLPASSSSAAANETARALELSLREVLDALSSASKKAASLPQPFPFDITTQSFPALCLTLLQPPATLFQPAPFSTSTTIPLKPPGPEHLQALRSKIRTTLDQWKWDALAHIQRNGMSQGSLTNVGEEAERLSQTTHKQIDESLRHLETAFQYFMSNSPEQQYSLWSIELLRALKVEQDKVKEANERMDRITQEASQLQQQIDYLSRCQWPREMALWPPERNTFSSAVQKELQKGDLSANTSLATVNGYGTSGITHSLGGAGDDRWDFDKLVNKWKRHVREDRARRGGGAGSMLPPLTDNHGGDSSTPPATMRKSTSDLSGLHNGHLHSSTQATDSPNIRNGIYGIGVNDKGTTFANASANANPTAGGGTSTGATGNSRMQYTGPVGFRLASTPPNVGQHPNRGNLSSSLTTHDASSARNPPPSLNGQTSPKDLLLVGGILSNATEAAMGLRYPTGKADNESSPLQTLASDSIPYPTRNHHMRL